MLFFDIYKAIQQFNVSPYIYAVYWLRPGSSAFLLARKCNWLAGIIVMSGLKNFYWVALSKVFPYTVLLRQDCLVLLINAVYFMALFLCIWY